MNSTKTAVIELKSRTMLDFEGKMRVGTATALS